MEPKDSKGAQETSENRVEALEQELAEVKKRNDELLTRLKYTQADQENFRKRMDRESKEAGESLTRSLVTRLLVVQDELDLAARHADGGTGNGELKEGIGMVRKNLEAALESVGVERIDSVGMPFDPSIHEAVEKIQGEGGRDMVVEEIRSGYTFRGQLLRPSMVKVQLASKTAMEEKSVE